MNRKAVLHLVSYLTLVIGLAMICCSMVSVYYKEPVAMRNSLLLSGGISILFALILGYFTRGPVNLSRRDGFGVVTFGWLSVTVFGSHLISYPE